MPEIKQQIQDITDEDITIAYREKDYDLLAVYYSIIQDRSVFLYLLFNFLYYEECNKIDLFRFLKYIERIFELDEICYLLIINNANSFDDDYDIIDILRSLESESCKNIAKNYILGNGDINSSVIEYFFYKEYITTQEIENRLRLSNTHIRKDLLHLLSDEFILELAIKFLKVEMIAYYIKRISFNKKFLLMFIELNWIDEEKVIKIITMFLKFVNKDDFIDLIQDDKFKLRIFERVIS